MTRDRSNGLDQGRDGSTATGQAADTGANVAHSPEALPESRQCEPYRRTFEAVRPRVRCPIGRNRFRGNGIASRSGRIAKEGGHRGK